MILDLAIDEALAHEGIARDVVRAVQQARREAGLHVSDRIRLALELPADWRAAAEHFRAYIAEQTLATELALGAPAEGAGFSTHVAEVSGGVAARRAAPRGLAQVAGRRARQKRVITPTAASTPMATNFLAASRPTSSILKKPAFASSPPATSPPIP